MTNTKKEETTNRLKAGEPFTVRHEAEGVVYTFRKAVYCYVLFRGDNYLGSWTPGEQDNAGMGSINIKIYVFGRAFPVRLELERVVFISDRQNENR